MAVALSGDLPEQKQKTLHHKKVECLFVTKKSKNFYKVKSSCSFLNCTKGAIESEWENGLRKEVIAQMKKCN